MVEDLRSSHHTQMVECVRDPPAQLACPRRALSFPKVSCRHWCTKSRYLWRMCEEGNDRPNGPRAIGEA